MRAPDPAAAVVDRVLLSWSSGKDSAWALHRLREDGHDVVGLLTTINEAFDRVSMQGTRRRLAEQQAAAVGLPVRFVPLPWPCPNETYEAKMADAMARASQEGITHVAFGDLFLDDVRSYREEKLAGTGIEPLFPIWCGPEGTAALAAEMLAAGTSAYVTVVDPAQLDPVFAGRTFDEALLADLPPEVDPLGERGEFHTFAFGGPAFREPVRCALGEVVERDGFVYADVLPG